jgi:hypothetical protein
MPIHLEDLDVVSEVQGMNSAFIVPCNMCGAASVAEREGKPFLQLFRHFLKSAPFDQHIKSMQSRLKEEGVEAQLFKCNIPHQWFLCMCTSGRRKQIEKLAKQHDAAIVLGCDSAVETVRKAAKATNCKVVPGMETTGIMNANMKLHWSGKLTFEECEIVPISRDGEEEAVPGHH